MSEQHVRLLLGGVHLAPLIDRIEQRIRRGRPLDGHVTLRTADPEARAAVAALLGRPVGSGVSTSVRLADVDRVVRESGAAPDLATAVIQLRGPIPVAAVQAAAEQAGWDRAYRPLDEYARSHPDMAFLPDLLRQTGRLKASGRGATAAAAVIRDLVRVLEGLPGKGETLGAFSARVLHSAHALDRGPLRSLVEAVLDADSERHVERFDDRWAMVGIAVDSSASTVLIHALRFDRSDPHGRTIDDLVQLGRPVPLTLGLLSEGARPVADEVFVCENPAVVAAAASRFGLSSAPVVCVRGQPSAAAQRLLHLLSRSGSTIRYHGDFDWGGIRIANRVMSRYGARPWRYGVDDLAAAVAAGAPLAGSRVEASWDPHLATAVEARGCRLEEEQVLDSLLPDLAR